VRQLCWDYRSFLLNFTEVDRDITETFYPVPKYAALMDRLEQEHARPRGVILLARGAGAPIGCGMTHALDDETAEIKRVFVSETARNGGVARMICQALMDQARSDGFSRVVLDTSRSLVAAQALYARLGFAARGPYQPVPDDVLPHLLFFEAKL
jgi:GNAT superfamily N-acetyltransferase